MTFVAAVGYMGFAKSRLVSVIDIFAVVDLSLPIFKYSLPWYLLRRCSSSVSTVLWGRLYCGRICAFGALTQLMDTVVPKSCASRCRSRDRAARRPGSSTALLARRDGLFPRDARRRRLPLRRAVLDVQAVGTTAMWIGSRCCWSRRCSCETCTAGSCARSARCSASSRT